MCLRSRTILFYVLKQSCSAGASTAATMSSCPADFRQPTTVVFDVQHLGSSIDAERAARVLWELVTVNKAKLTAQEPLFDSLVSACWVGSSVPNQNLRDTRDSDGNASPSIPQFKLRAQVIVAVVGVLIFVFVGCALSWPVCRYVLCARCRKRAVQHNRKRNMGLTDLAQTPSSCVHGNKAPVEPDSVLVDNFMGRTSKSMDGVADQLPVVPPLTPSLASLSGTLRLLGFRSRPSTSIQHPSSESTSESLPALPPPPPPPPEGSLFPPRSPPRITVDYAIPGECHKSQSLNSILPT